MGEAGFSCHFVAAVLPAPISFVCLSGFLSSPRSLCGLCARVFVMCAFCVCVCVCVFVLGPAPGPAVQMNFGLSGPFLLLLSLLASLLNKGLLMEVVHKRRKAEVVAGAGQGTSSGDVCATVGLVAGCASQPSVGFTSNDL